MTLKIGLDYDDTMIRFFEEFIKYYNYNFEDSVSYSEIDRWNPLVNFKKLSSQEELDELFKEFIEGSNIFGPPPDYKGVVKYFKQLQGDGHKLYIITARPELKEVYKWLATNGLPITNVFSSKDKWWIAEELDLDIFVDDNIMHLESVEKVRPSCTVVAYDQPWNAAWQGKKVSSWEELYKLIGELDLVHSLGGPRRLASMNNSTTQELKPSLEGLEHLAHIHASKQKSPTTTSTED